jgi:hypothetical protein
VEKTCVWGRGALFEDWAPVKVGAAF